jgi:hypothetical protein
MNIRRRETEGGLSGVSSKGVAAKNTVNDMKIARDRPQAINNAIGLKPTGGGYKKIKGAVSG